MRRRFECSQKKFCTYPIPTHLTRRTLFWVPEQLSRPYRIISFFLSCSRNTERRGHSVGCAVEMELGVFCPGRRSEVMMSMVLYIHIFSQASRKPVRRCLISRKLAGPRRGGLGILPVFCIAIQSTYLKGRTGIDGHRGLWTEQ